MPRGPRERNKEKHMPDVLTPEAELNAFLAELFAAKKLNYAASGFAAVLAPLFKVLTGETYVLKEDSQELKYTLRRRVNEAVGVSASDAGAVVKAISLQKLAAQGASHEQLIEALDATLFTTVSGFDGVHLFNTVGLFDTENSLSDIEQQ